jgi:putative membrane protein
MLVGCRAEPGPLVRDHYASLEDCVADWGRAEHCDRVRSSGYAGGKLVYRGLAYRQNEREAARRDALAGAAGPGAADPAQQGRAIATVKEHEALDGASARGRAAPLPEPGEDAGPATVLDSLAGLPYFVAYLGIALMLLTLGLAAYVALGARGDMRRIRDGNVAAAADMAGALVGFALPLASAVIVTASLLDLLVWSAVAVVVQLVVVVGLRLMMSPLVRRAREGQVASGVFLGAVAAVVGVLNAASIIVGL